MHDDKTPEQLRMLVLLRETMIRGLDRILPDDTPELRAMVAALLRESNDRDRRTLEQEER